MADIGLNMFFPIFLWLKNGLFSLYLMVYFFLEPVGTYEHLMGLKITGRIELSTDTHKQKTLIRRGTVIFRVKFMKITSNFFPNVSNKSAQTRTSVINAIKV